MQQFGNGDQQRPLHQARGHHAHRHHHAGENQTVLGADTVHQPRRAEHAGRLEEHLEGVEITIHLIAFLQGRELR